jgi:hypothetical protein
MKALVGLTLACFLCCFVEVAIGASFKGYDSNSTTHPMEFTEPVERFKETDSDFLILFTHHPAFYRFPNSDTASLQVRRFLQSRIVSRQRVFVKFDPTTTRILELKDDNKK